MINGNMWDYGWYQVEHDFDGDADAFVLDLHKETIKEYEDKGLTVWDHYNLGNGHKITVPPHRRAAAIASVGVDKIQ